MCFVCNRMAISQYGSDRTTGALLLLTIGCLLWPSSSLAAQPLARARANPGGEDSQFARSPDGKTVVFVREIQKEAPNPETVTPGSNRTQLWLVGTEPGARARLIVDCPIEVDGSRYFSYGTPQWSPDGLAIYFSISYSVVTPAIVRFSLRDQRISLVATAEAFHVIQAGKYKGDIAVLQRRLTASPPEHHEWFWLLGPDGSTIELIGRSKGDLAKFEESYGEKTGLAPFLP